MRNSHGTTSSSLLGFLISERTSFICPDCGQFALLEDHNINENGVVEPSVVYSNEDCD
jgi:predicted RNA-binding Zn-ribbon protein involved in translation (DUF1610 family)